MMLRRNDVPGQRQAPKASPKGKPQRQAPEATHGNKTTGIVGRRDAKGACGHHKLASQRDALADDVAGYAIPGTPGAAGHAH